MCEQMIEMKVFSDINKMHPIERMTLEYNTCEPAAQKSKKGWLKKLFKFKRQVHVHELNLQFHNTVDNYYVQIKFVTKNNFIFNSTAKCIQPAKEVLCLSYISF